MRSLKTLCFFIILSVNANAQINGNGVIKTITQPMLNLTEIDIQFNAHITLDYELEETMRITADENILEYIGITYKNGKLTLDQIKWIEPSRQPIIIIGSPKLTSIYQGTHSQTLVKNVNTSKLNLEGNVGKIKADGRTSELTVITTGTDIDLTKLNVVNAYVTIRDDSKVILDKVGNLNTDLDQDARLILLSEVDRYQKTSQDDIDRYKGLNSKVKLIDFKIKNNSWKRNHFVVQGPKKDGSSFSYGFSLLPHASKNEKWSIGTKIYKEKKSGARELLVTINESDEGSLVKLFK